MPPMPGSVPIRLRKSCSPRARPAIPRASSTPSGCCCANQAMIRSTLVFIADEPPSWSTGRHGIIRSAATTISAWCCTMAARFTSTRASRCRASIEATVRNLREIAPTIHLNVPKGFEMLLPYLRNDAALRQNFFSRMKVLFYRRAGLAQHVWDELQAMAVATTGERIIFLPASARRRPRRPRSRARGNPNSPATSACRCAAWRSSLS